MQRFLPEAYTESISGSLLRSNTTRNYDRPLSTTTDPFEDPKSVVTTSVTGQLGLEIDDGHLSSSVTPQSKATSSVKLDLPPSHYAFSQSYQEPFPGAFSPQSNGSESTSTHSTVTATLTTFAGELSDDFKIASRKRPLFWDDSGKGRRLQRDLRASRAALRPFYPHRPGHPAQSRFCAVRRHESTRA